MKFQFGIYHIPVYDQNVKIFATVHVHDVVDNSNPILLATWNFYFYYIIVETQYMGVKAL